MAWLSFEGLVNARDLGGTPTTSGGTVQPGRLLRSDNLQNLTDADLAQLRALKVTDVVDLRSHMEVGREGPGPMTRQPGVHIHHFTYLPEADGADNRALPWVGLTPTVGHADTSAAYYLSYLADRPDSVVGALRAIAYADGAALVHCAAGKDRTGITIGLALSLAGAPASAIVADYAASSERMQQIVDKLSASETYRANLEGRPISSHLTRPETMQAFLDYLTDEYGGAEPALARIGWAPEDTAKMRAKLLD